MRLRNWLIPAATIPPLAVLGAVLWVRMTQLPSYVLTPEGKAEISLQGQAQIFAADSNYAVIGLAGGLVFGAICWSFLRDLGWPVALVAAAESTLGGLLSWGLGTLFGPNNFDARLAAASVNQIVVIDLELRSMVAVLSWPVGALVVVLLASALAAGEPLAFGSPRRGKTQVLGERIEGETVIDDQGVATPKE